MKIAYWHPSPGVTKFKDFELLTLLKSFGLGFIKEVHGQIEETLLNFTLKMLHVKVEVSIINTNPDNLLDKRFSDEKCKWSVS